MSELKEKIFELMKRFNTPCEYGITSSDESLIAREIAAMVELHLPSTMDIEIILTEDGLKYDFDEMQYVWIGMVYMRAEIMKRNALLISKDPTPR